MNEIDAEVKVTYQARAGFFPPTAKEDRAVSLATGLEDMRRLNVVHAKGVGEVNSSRQHRPQSSPALAGWGSVMPDPRCAWLLSAKRDPAL
jgi:hypothetical protein